jgi:hypothetical protein
VLVLPRDDVAEVAGAIDHRTAGRADALDDAADEPGAGAVRQVAEHRDLPDVTAGDHLVGERTGHVAADSRGDQRSHSTHDVSAGESLVGPFDAGHARGEGLLHLLLLLQVRVEREVADVRDLLPVGDGLREL